MTRRWVFYLVSCLGLCVAGLAAAQAPERSLHPVPRPAAAGTETPRASTVPVRYNATARPAPRPSPRNPAAAATIAIAPNTAPPTTERPRIVQLVPPTVPGVSRSLRPRPRPARRIRQAAADAARQTAQPRDATFSPAPTTRVPDANETRAERRRRERAERRAARRSGSTTNRQPLSGSVCGDRTIRGEEISAIPGRLQGCGVADPVRVTEIDGVALTQSATITCETAQALKTWINTGVRPAVGRLGGGVKSLRVVAHYACRTRNNQPGARISEHGRGKAIDIAAINLNNGSSLTVLDGWRDRTQSQMLRSMHTAACGPFGTVLGPNADRHHQDHFHFDTAGYRSGPYCR